MLLLLDGAVDIDCGAADDYGDEDGRDGARGGFLHRVPLNGKPRGPRRGRRRGWGRGAWQGRR